MIRHALTSSQCSLTLLPGLFLLKMQCFRLRWKILWLCRGGCHPCNPASAWNSDLTLKHYETRIAQDMHEQC